ncbi:cytosine permease [Gluconacetobacter entanii]|uniref:Cytosine permease n=1 Tax=Gluconacetobacter entanii TaxID=108528 RepID=A0A318PRK6_9PROT|nr:cytosine permease [Gluconacetobacter entanii]MBE7620815.1 cytosine permease [Komagataeibacter sp. FXV2]MCE2579455.1 cytosine permease [Komagataeibacter sp. FNDCR1]MBY4639614.1 cytosine permease [Gluconacetobacter entanii]MCW4579278.1 cytosine permease [Gluconacetobacter entanii]MCW4582675.1 cytosine permease [Gluconacetobacter entanii]
MATTFESHTIYQIPEDQRYGRVSDLFSVWFSTNMTLLTVVTGALGPTVFGLSFGWSLLAAVAGNMVGAVFMALHAAQGPMLGVPQMVQSRGQFGSYGAVPIVILVIIMYVGFAASNYVVGGQALVQAMPGLNRTVGVLTIAIVSLVPCCMGYRAIHVISKVVSWLAGGVVLVCIGLGLWRFSGGMLMDMHGSVAGIFSAFSVSALWQVAYAPYVSDSSRYLPNSAASVRNTFLATYAGTVLGTILPMMLGIVLACQWSDLTTVEALARLCGGGAGIVLVVLSLAITLGNAMGVYCGALSTITVVQTFWPDWRPAMISRVVVTLCLVTLALVMAFGMSANFMKSYAAFLDILMAVIVPWTAINLTDYYLLRHGEYDVASFFRADGGCYGYFNMPAVASYVVGVVVELPFLKNDLYTGFLLPYLYGVDISWLVSLIVTTVVYVLLYRGQRQRAARRQAA